MGRRARRVAGVTALVLALGTGGYLVADAYDVVPGVLTLDPPPPTPAPFPTLPPVADAPVLEPAVGNLDPQAPVPSADTVAALARSLAGDARMGTSTSVVVADVLTGQVLVDIGGAAPQIPASTTKLLTAFAAITALGTERTLTTAVVEAEPGRVVLVGGGDMLLAAGAGDPTAVNGRAGLGDLAAQAAAALLATGRTEVALGFDDTLFAGPALNAGWRPSYMFYVAPITPLAVDAGRTTAELYSRRHDDPALVAAQTFARLLAEQGVTVTGGPTRTVAPGGAPRLAAVESAPMREIVRYVTQTSDNTAAEVLGHLVAIERGAPATFAGATSAVVAELAAHGIDTRGTSIADCSGLADGSLLPGRLLVDLLVLAARPGNVDLLPVVVDLPIGGWQGTLAERYLDGAAEGLVRAKTGSLPGVTSLAGTVQTQGGRLLAFAVLADETPPGGQDRPRAAIDALVQQLAAAGAG